MLKYSNGNEVLTGRKYVLRTDGHADGQCENLFPRHKSVTGYKKWGVTVMKEFAPQVLKLAGNDQSSKSLICFLKLTPSDYLLRRLYNS